MLQYPLVVVMNATGQIRPKGFRVLVLALLMGSSAAMGDPSEWSVIAPGISYREYVLAGPVRVYAARADRAVDTWTIDTMSSLSEIKGGRETVPGMVRRYDDTITSDGSRYAIKVAINGDYFDMKTGVALGGQIMSGWFVKRCREYAGSGLVWTTDRRCFLGGDVQNSAKLQHVTFADGTQMKIDQLNEPRGENALALYTPQFAGNTGTTSEGAEVIAQVDTPVCVLPPKPGVKAKISQIRKDTGATPLAFDTVVLSAHGKAAAELLKHVHAGEDMRIDLGLMEFGNKDIGLQAGDWHNAYASIGGPKSILVNRVVPRDWEAKAAKYAAEGKKHGSVVKDPRTCIAFNEHYVYFFVIDGRYEGSLGMTFTETGEFCRDELKATDAVLEDGGGSSVLWVDGTIKNRPSGKPGQDEAGALRPVANGCYFALVQPPKKSNALKAGQKIEFTTDGELRLGPGSNYPAAGPVHSGKTGRILPQRLNGVFATGGHWWNCAVEDAKGWVAADRFRPSE